MNIYSIFVRSKKNYFECPPKFSRGHKAAKSAEIGKWDKTDFLKYLSILFLDTFEGQRTKGPYRA